MPEGRTIAAISTPPGKGGVAVIRISGSEAIAIAERIFRPRSSRPISSYPKRTQIYGYVLLAGEPIDDGLLTLFPAPNSYTGEDIAEISCHGGVLITSRVLEAAIVGGARPAERGEFTRRAFLSGKLSLTEAEAIGQLLDAESDAKIRLYRSESRERLTAELEQIRKSLTTLLASLYARIDYPDEDLGDFTDEETVSELDSIISRVDTLLATYKTGHAVSEGVRTVICGKPNVGKSTLYNLLVGEDAAIVTDIPGTTRDVLDRTVPLGDVLVRLSDTAGIRGGKLDTVEAIGIERSRDRVANAELILALFDSSRDLDEEDEELIGLLSEVDAPCIAVITKADKSGSGAIRERLASIPTVATVEISALRDPTAAREAITAAVAKLFNDEGISIGEDAIIASARQNAALTLARGYLTTAKDSFLIGLPQDAASSDLELALGAVAEIDGRAVSEDVVADIFSRFCVGK